MGNLTHMERRKKNIEEETIWLDHYLIDNDFDDLTKEELNVLINRKNTINVEDDYSIN